MTQNYRHTFVKTDRQEWSKEDQRLKPKKDMCPTYVPGQMSEIYRRNTHDEGRDTCLFNQIDFPSQTSFSLKQF